MSSTNFIWSILSITLLVMLLVLLVIIVFFISSKKRLRQEMELAQTKLNFEKELRQAETELSEHLMEQFAQEIHDNVGQLLVAMKIQIENQKLDHPEWEEGLKPVEIYLSEVISQLRLLSRTLNKDYVGQVGLMESLQLEVDRLRQLKRFNVILNNEASHSYLDKNQELMVFRILQEIFQNALRHSGASNLVITVDNEEKNFTIKIEDDGKGFDPATIFQSRKASGLRNILKRSRLASMDCSIESTPGKGTRYQLSKMKMAEPKIK